jgi:hypothetical protein
MESWLRNVKMICSNLENSNKTVSIKRRQQHRNKLLPDVVLRENTGGREREREGYGEGSQSVSSSSSSSSNNNINSSGKNTNSMLRKTTRGLERKQQHKIAEIGFTVHLNTRPRH